LPFEPSASDATQDCHRDVSTISFQDIDDTSVVSFVGRQLCRSRYDMLLANRGGIGILNAVEQTQQ
jgi:hypothetical protein